MNILIASYLDLAVDLVTRFSNQQAMLTAGLIIGVLGIALLRFDPRG